MVRLARAEKFATGGSRIQAGSGDAIPPLESVGNDFCNSILGATLLVIYPTLGREEGTYNILCTNGYPGETFRRISMYLFTSCSKSGIVCPGKGLLSWTPLTTGLSPGPSSAKYGQQVLLKPLTR